MSKNSLIIVLRINKQKNSVDIAKIEIKSEDFTLFSKLFSTKSHKNCCIIQSLVQQDLRCQRPWLKNSHKTLFQDIM